VSKRLREKEIPTSTGKLWWDRTVVWAILKNPEYQGQAVYGKTRAAGRCGHGCVRRGAPRNSPRAAYSTYAVPTEEWIHIPVPAIVSGELYELVQEQLEENRSRARQRRRGARDLLQRLVVCKRYGYAFYGKPVSLGCAATVAGRDSHPLGHRTFHGARQ